MRQRAAETGSLAAGRFVPDNDVLQVGDAKTGRANVRSGTDIQTGARIIIKQWVRNSASFDPVIQEIWRQEIRQIHRLMGYPGAKDFIAPLVDSGFDEGGFYLVLGPGQRLPLPVILDQVARNHWLNQPRLELNRLRIWTNLDRIASGLSLLHVQGLLHRNLDQWAILTSGEEEPDFQLSGFEWSVRLSSAARIVPLQDSNMAGDRNTHSFLQDWYAFGVLAATLFGADAKVFLERKTDDGSDAAAHLTGLERALIMRLLRADPFSRVDGDSVRQEIAEIQTSLMAIVDKRQERLCLTPHLGVDSRVSQAIRSASDRTIEIDDLEGQVEFIAGDIAEGAQLVIATTHSETPTRRYLLIGRVLVYRLSPYRHPGPAGKAPTTWAIAYCDGISEKRPVAADIIGHKRLANGSIDIVMRSEIATRFPKLQGRTGSWDRQVQISEDNGLSEHRQYRALLLVQILEALHIASEIWPVEVHSVVEDQGKYTVALTAREDQERDKLSAALGLKETAVRMQEAFATDQWQSEEAWKLTDIGVLGEKETGTHEWSFLEVVEKAGEPVSYLFEGNSPMEVGDELFLRRSNYVGTDRLLNRRVKALLALREHAELLDSLEDPRGVVRPTHETPEEDEQFKLLDESKQAALLDIWEVMPLYLLQGPPGVGKTRLVRELVRRKIAEDPSARLLLSAQSHDAVDHLLQEIGKEFDAGGDDLLIVRSRPRDDKRPPGKYDLHTQAAGLLSRVSKGRLFAELPPHIRSKLDDLDPDQLATTADESDQTTLRRADRSIEALLLRAANLVFASTNARDLERLIEERSQFDWSIVEEAGKATGPELLAPLLLSHRRLMIGDHKQLPPFGADRLQSLLGNPEAIRQALEVGTSLVGWVFREAGLDEIIDDSNAIDDFTAACGDAAAALVMFETLIEQCLPKKENSKRRRDVAKQLSFQHRMHPAIAKLVSTTFYDGELHTHEGTLDRYMNETPPFSVAINDVAVRSPIVFVDMPFVQSTIGKQEIEKKPRYYNDEEIETVIDILSNLRANSDREKPSVAVLAPYVEQVKRLRNRYFEERKPRLHGLSSFSFEGGADTPVGTVDSFQGNEADVVIVSLVRNNARSGKKGLGFLADPRRMNVLLSRAKWKLFIVGSREFLSTRFDGKTDGDLEFLRRMLGSLQAQTKTASINGVVDVSFVNPLIFGKEKK
ncbi:TPA: hypothetical protein VDB83_001690 [Burkholderia cenocepacia]|nr:hypothetical protein [Burkholderia cenocepacia]